MLIATAQQFVDSLEHITGFVVVLVSLTLLWGITLLIGKLLSLQSTPKAAAAAMATPSEPIQSTGNASEEDPTEEEVAVICATIAAMLQERQRLVSIRSITPSWGKEGLREHFASHRIR